MNPLDLPPDDVPTTPRPARPPTPDASDDRQTEIDRLERRLAEATSLLDSTRASLKLHGLRGEGLQAGIDGAHHRIGQLERSVSWKVTSPLRVARALASGRLANGRSFRDALSRIVSITEQEGASGLGRRVARTMLPDILFRQRRRPAPVSARLAGEQAPVDPYQTAIPVSGRTFLAPSFLIVAELSIPQCAKYRVWQKQELLRSLGWSCTVVNWRELGEVTTALQLCSQVIFYRVPAEKAVLALLAEARRLGLDPWWEVDDLIFDEASYRKNSNLKTLSRQMRHQVLAGGRLYRKAMLACGRTIASTERLAQCMRDAGIAETRVVENALDAETLEVAAGLREIRRQRLDTALEPSAGPVPTVTIVYGSGTKTHDADFVRAAPAIVSILKRYPQVQLQIIGDLTLPPEFELLAERVTEIAGTNYRAYLGLLASADIAIAPLEATIFNDAKSNIKFQEAAILAMPSVASPAEEFRRIIVPGENGFLAATTAEWETALERLILDPALRRRIGARALDDVTARYAPERIAREQVVTIAGLPPEQARAPLRILSANIFFKPQSFGGATIVAQEMATRLAAAPGLELCVFTSRPAIPDRPPSLLRYDLDDIPVFATSLSPASDQVVQLDNPSICDTFGRLLDAVRPDVVHAHSIQGFGASILRLCRERGIPYVVTLHDAWWLCDRQFMVRGDNTYCFQTRIDLRVCQNCLPHARHLDERMRIMTGILDGASLLLSPSPTHRRLYLANGIAPDRIGVNRNGIRLPTLPRTPRRPGAPLRFGFVGGAEPIKGYHLIRKVFESLGSSDWELVLVDNTLNLGFRSIDVSSWRVEGTITIIPAYTQDGLDGFFDRIDVLLFPSQWKESFGLSVREALSRDVWVVATEGGGQADDIQDGINGRLIALDGHETGLSAAVEELLLTPERLDSYVNPARAAIASYDDQAAELLSMLREITDAALLRAPTA